MGSSRGLLLIFESLLEFSLFGMAEVLIPVKVCLLVTIVLLAKDLPATPILAEVLRVELVITVQDAGVLAGGLGTLRGVWIGGGNAGLVKVSTDLETSPFFSVRIRMMDDLLHPEVSSNAK